MRTYEVTITGISPLLMHADDIEWADKMDAWKADPKNKMLGKAGDDRSPAHRWIGSLYMSDECVAIPADNIMRCLMEGGAMVPVPGGKNGKTFKTQSQTGVIIGETHWPVIGAGGQLVPRAEVEALTSVEQFGDHVARVRELGFSLFTKRARIGTSKHIRVRPRFNQWRAHGTVMVNDPQITDSVIQQFFDYAGKYKGLGDWRPSSKTPGAFGMFTAEVLRV